MRLDYGYEGRGNSLSMSIAVPPDIASKIDAEVEKDVYFPDAFLKALYPGLIGPDNLDDIKRLQTEELQVLDTTVKPLRSEIRKYPQPIPY